MTTDHHDESFIRLHDQCASKRFRLIYYSLCVCKRIFTNLISDSIYLLRVSFVSKCYAWCQMCALIRYESERILHRISFRIKFTGHRFELYKLIKCAVKLLFFIIIDAYVYRTVVDCCCWKIPSPDSDSSKSIRETMNNSMVRKCASSAHTENETH